MIMYGLLGSVVDFLTLFYCVIILAIKVNNITNEWIMAVGY